MNRKYVVWFPVIAAVLGFGQAHLAAGEKDFRPLSSGVEYRHDARAKGPLSIHVLRLDRRQKWDLQTGLGQGTVYGLEALPGIVRRVGAAVKKPAAAAINGDFFVIKTGPYQGDPRGVQIVQGELVSRPAGRSFWVSPQNELKIGLVESKLRIRWPDGKTETPIGLNEARADDHAVLYTPSLGLRAGETPSAKNPPATRTQGGREFILERIEGQPWLPVQAGKSYSAKVGAVRDGGDSPLAPHAMVLSIGPNLSVPAVKAGDVLKVVLETSPGLEGVQTALGVGRILIAEGKFPDLGPAEQPRHPRSMIGWNDKHLLLFVIDGRQKELSIGMTYPEMAALAREYGCSEAAELDGGGSSTLWAGGKILNSPSDGRPRALANGLVIFRSDKE